MAATNSYLPPELYSMIFIGLPQYSLCSICLSSKQLRALAEPILYSQGPTYRRRTSAHYRKFLFTMIRRPELRIFCKRLDYGQDIYGSGFYQRETKTDYSDFETLLEQVHELGLLPLGWESMGLDQCLATHGRHSFLYLWKSYISGPQKRYRAGLDAIILLSLLPNIKDLEIDCDWFVRTVTPLETALKANKALTLLNIHIWRRKENQNTPQWIDSKVSVLTTLPSLRELSCYRCRFMTLLLPPESLSVEKIVLILCDVTPLIIDNLIYACRQLKSFHYSWKPDLNVDEILAISCGILSSLLRKHQNTIENLELFIERERTGELTHSIYSFMSYTQLARAGELSTFPKLRNLTIEYYFLSVENAGAVNALEHILPPSIETVTIKYSRGAIRQHLRSLFDQIPHRFTRLRKIHIEMRSAFPEDAVIAPVQAFQKRGVHLSFEQLKTVTDVEFNGTVHPVKEEHSHDDGEDWH